MHISDHFDGGAIEVVRADRADDICLRLRTDNVADIRQWFHFRLMGAANQPVRLIFENASDSAYPQGWEGYRCVASYDRHYWFRIHETRYEDGKLLVEHTPERNSVYYAYFEPYSLEQHLALIGRVEPSPFAEIDCVARSVEGRDIERITVGRIAPGRKPIWIIARQHPGETMAEWLIEGLLERLLDAADPVARRIRERAVLHIVPNMNPDGSVLGNLRTNSAGRNLNREWLTPDPVSSPEVFHVREAMERSGCALFLDIHGDEALPYVFIAPADEVPGLPADIVAQQQVFLSAFALASPDFQTVYGYERGRFGEELLTLASNWVAHRFGCLSLTLEMPFKDNANMPDGRVGWNSIRSKRLGAAILQPILAYLESGRAEK